MKEQLRQLKAELSKAVSAQAAGARQVRGDGGDEDGMQVRMLEELIRRQLHLQKVLQEQEQRRQEQEQQRRRRQSQRRRRKHVGKHLLAVEQRQDNDARAVFPAQPSTQSVMQPALQPVLLASTQPRPAQLTSPAAVVAAHTFSVPSSVTVGGALPIMVPPVGAPVMGGMTMGGISGVGGVGGMAVGAAFGGTSLPLNPVAAPLTVRAFPCCLAVTASGRRAISSILMLDVV